MSDSFVIVLASVPDKDYHEFTESLRALPLHKLLLTATHFSV